MPMAEAPLQALRETGLHANDDPTVRGAWLFPEALDEGRGWGVEPGGGVRAIVAGVRLVSMAGGSMRVASDRLPATPSNVVALPERLGGGFLFTIGVHLWRAATWLGSAMPLYSSSLPIAQVLVGLDRVYLRAPQGGLVALDPRNGSPIVAGPLPASPNIGKLAASDAWRAIAIADLRGVLLTLDAGATWRPILLHIEPSDVVSMSDALVVGGFDEGRQMQWWEVRGDGQSARPFFLPAGFSADRLGLQGERAAVSSSPRDGGDGEGDRGKAAEFRTFGPYPLLAAVEDGWPLADGTALVARDGALARVRLSDGAVVESVGDAFSLRPARCHALSLASSRFPGAVGFVCGEPRGRTAIYRFDPAMARLVELRRFKNPRQVLGFGNGGLGVRGPCAADAVGDPSGREQPWCVLSPDASWTDRRYPVDERLVILADGGAALLRPPLDGDLSCLRLTIENGGRRSEHAVALPPLHADVAQALRLGVWLEGFEERRPGVIGGWIDTAGAVTGIEIASNGEARIGEYIRDAGGPVTSGRWAFGWTASRRGFETTDGGMTWAKEIPLPDPIAQGRGAHERVCGPIGCLAAGWVRIGWGGTEQPMAAEPRPYVVPSTRAAPNLDLECETPSGPEHVATDAAAAGARLSSPAPGPAWAKPSALPPFAERSPSVASGALGLTVEASHALERGLRAGPLARVYAWGPKSGEWDQLGRWQVRWQWPWGGRQDARSSTASVGHWATLDAARRALSPGPGTPTTWIFANGDDPDHALLLARHTAIPASVEILLLETDRPVVEARRPTGEPIPDVEAATRVGGVWYVATTQGPGELAATVVWSLEGAVAREIARVPRAGFEARPVARLARRADGHGIALVVDGPRDELRGTTQRWLAAVDLESHSIAAPEPLAPTDLSDRSVSFCAGDDDGWVIDLPYPGAVRLHLAGGLEPALEGSFGRMRLSHERACVERVLGSVADHLLPGVRMPNSLARATPGATPATPATPASGSTADKRSIEASVLSGALRYTLRCTERRGPAR
jgi:hypothetical protein